MIMLLILSETEQFNFLSDDYTGYKQSLAMIPFKTLGNMDKNFSSHLADFGH